MQTLEFLKKVLPISGHYVNTIINIDGRKQGFFDNIEDLVSEMYKGLDPRLHNGACRAVHSHLIHMIETDRAACNGAPSPEALYSLPS